MLSKSNYRRLRSAATLILLLLAPPARAAKRRLEIADLTVDPPIAGRNVTDLEWLPRGDSFSYVVRKGSGEDKTFELWIEEAGSGRKRLAIPASALAMAPPGPGTSASAKPEKLSLDDYRWSPDGQSVLLTGIHDLWLYRLDGRGLTRLTRSGEEEEFPTFSPDGRRIAFVREHDLFVLDVASGQETRLTTDGTEAIHNGRLDWVYEEELADRTGRAFEWSPDGTMIAYLRLDDSPVAPSPITDFLTAPATVSWQRFPLAGGKNPAPSLHVIGVDGKPRTEVRPSSDGYIEPSFSWTADSRSVCYRLTNRAQTQREVRLLTISSGSSRLLFAEEDPHWINADGTQPPRFLRDGRYLWKTEKSGFAHLAVGDISGRAPAAITSGNWMVDQVIGLDESKGIVYFTGTKDDVRRRPIYRVALNGSGLSRLTTPAGTHTAKLSPDGQYLLDTHSSVAQPPVISLLEASGRTIRVVDAPENRLSEFELAHTEEHVVTAADGTSLMAALTKPPHFDPSRKYPVIVYVYGGPHAQVVKDAWNGSLMDQLLASRGFLVWSLDNRGSWGRGHAWESVLSMETGKHELADQLAGVSYLKTLPFVDPARIGIWGWSYGGYMTLYALTRAPDVWKCGVAGAPVTHWKFYDTIYTERYMKTPQENPQGYEASAPLSKAADLKAKLLVIQGLADDNVHPQNMIAFLDALTKAGRPYQLQIQSGQNHGFRGKESLDFRNAAIVKFFEENL
ncbi:MAG TPA: S9 family peptidase [Thermoanaerobaculia bacterium]